MENLKLAINKSRGGGFGVGLNGHCLSMHFFDALFVNSGRSMNEFELWR